MPFPDEIANFRRRRLLDNIAGRLELLRPDLEQKMSAFVIVNPRSGGGKTLRDWRMLEKALASVYPHMSVAFTRRPGEATMLAASALREGHSEIVAIGGDRTVNEAVNGFFDSEGAISPDAVLAFVSGGAANDLWGSRNEDGPATVSHLKQAAVRPIDVGRVRFLSRDGLPRTRYFANIASFGLSGLIADAVNHSMVLRLFGGRFASGWHTALGLLRYNGRAVRLMIDSSFDEIVNVAAVAVANRCMFGMGQQAKEATPGGDPFDVVIIRNGSKARMLSDLKCLYSRENSTHSTVRIIRGSRIVAAPVAETRGRAVLIETDGEAVGRLPATFEILPRALNVRC
jgi:diacylglycerol kinase (ATP)